MVMKRIFFMSLICFSLSTYAQSEIEGTYEDEFGYKVVIKDSMFYYIEPQKHLALLYNDTLAVCSIRECGNEFIELNTTQSPSQRLYQGFSVKTESSSDMNEHIDVYFSTLYTGKLDISLFIFPSDSIVAFEYSQSNNKVKIPHDVESFYFKIGPKFNDIPLHDFGGCYYGVLFVASRMITIKNSREKIDRIYINIPAFTNDFFEKYYVYGEYAKITSGEITWKGRTFKKVNNIIKL